jgi:pimeloyl-[acyl-carrier protein] methyl ester esterase
MRFVFVHGWGFHAGIWSGLISYLPGAEVTLVDLGFLEGGPEGASEWPSDAIAVGHSLGALWLLQQGGAGGAAMRRFRALLSIQGFDCFCPHIPPSRVAGMRRELKRDAGGTLQAFWHVCGTEAFAPSEALNVDRLDEGLGWLMDWDAREAKARLDCPVLALAAIDDAIVPEAMSEGVWGRANIRWSQAGGHVLPLRHPEWCARHVLDFAHGLEP